MVTHDIEKRLEKLDEASDMLKILAHPVRLSILCNLLHKGEMSVNKIVELEQASQSQVSQYLNLLKRVGYVRHRREGQTIFYDFASNKVRSLIETLYGIYCQGES